MVIPFPLSADQCKVKLHIESRDRNIKSIVVIGFAYYHQDNFWSKDRNMVIYYRYDKDITMDYTSVPEPAMTWSKPGLVQLTMDHSAVPDPDADQYHRNLGTGNPEHRNGIGTAKMACRGTVWFPFGKSRFRFCQGSGQWNAEAQNR